jgi:hypothetical protein
MYFYGIMTINGSSVEEEENGGDDAVHVSEQEEAPARTSTSSTGKYSCISVVTGNFGSNISHTSVAKRALARKG